MTPRLWVATGPCEPCGIAWSVAFDVNVPPSVASENRPVPSVIVNAALTSYVADVEVEVNSHSVPVNEV